MTAKVITILAILVVLLCGAGFKVAQARSTATKRTPSKSTRKSVRAYVSHSTAHFAAKPVGEHAQVAGEPLTITIDAARTYQSIVGFGGAFTDAACYMFDRLPADSRKTLFAELFGKDAMQLNVIRVCLGSSDYATHVYSYCDGPADPELTRFSLDHDRKYILPILKEARSINPEIFLFGSPWSPPGWMKSNKSMLGGNMQRRYMSSYAHYFLKFLQGYAAAGVPVQAVTVQNEVDTDQDGKMPACAWPQEYEVDFVRHHLGPVLRAAGQDTQIWIIDHNYNLWGRALGSLDTEGLTDYASAIAWHGYVGDATRIDTVKQAYPAIDMYWTEGGPDYTDPNYKTDWCKWGRSFTSNLRNHCRAITVWNLALDEQGRPNIGPFPCGGLVTIDSQTGAISHSGQYYALGQFSRHVKRGAIRIGSESLKGTDTDSICHVAFVNPDGEKVLVVTNSGGARALALVVDQDTTVSVDVDADSVTTFVWR